MTTLRHIRHSRSTRIAHGGMALAVGVDVVTSLIQEPPGQIYPANVFFQVHQAAGLAAGAFALALWLIMVFRKVGTPFGLLVPWFSARRLAAVWLDLKAQLGGLRAHHRPPYHEAAPFSSAMQGLGLVLISAMALTGTIYFAALHAGAVNRSSAVLAMGLHRTLGDLVWAFLLGHGLVSLIHHYGLDKSLAEMWSLGRTPIEKD